MILSRGMTVGARERRKERRRAARQRGSVGLHGDSPMFGTSDAAGNMAQYRERRDHDRKAGRAAQMRAQVRRGRGAVRNANTLGWVPGSTDAATARRVRTEAAQGKAARTTASPEKSPGLLTRLTRRLFGRKTG